MKKRIFASISLFTLISIFIFNIILSNVLYSNFINSQISSATQELNYLKTLISNELTTISSVSSSHRITLFDENGDVIFDNAYDISKMHNHSNRKEFIDALLTGYGEDSRNSQTLGVESHYFATLLEDGTILRISFESSTMLAIMLENASLILFITVVFLTLALIVSKLLTDYVVNPIRIDKPNYYDELTPFFETIQKQKEHISSQKQVLEQKIHEFDAISNNIADGLILLDSNEKILSINKKAVKTLGQKNISYIDKDIIVLTRLSSITNAVSKCYEGNFLEETITIGNKIFSFKLSPVFSKNKVVGIIILIIDNTKKLEAENIRREFSANVSHELRTPLTSIYGYAELIKSGLARPEDIIPFAENIHSESEILINLIEDIIKISKLDENISEFEYVDIKLNDMINSIVSRLDVQISAKNISVSTDLEELSTHGVYQILQESFYNIIQNSVKYNKLNGSIEISAKKDENYNVITIKDSGIGIPQDLLHRIFERFYRVDTSHSKTITGTGLGLAIAKHGITFHDGHIEVSSVLNMSTTFKIFLKH